MPCGGIKVYSDVPPGPCFLCNEPDAEYYCEEWDCMLHEKCIIPFLRTPEGTIVMEHRHAITLKGTNLQLRSC